MRQWMESQPSLQHIRYSVRHGVAEITLASPQSRNALSFGRESNREELTLAFATADEDQNVKCILLSAEGPHFCAGGDLSRTEARNTSLEQRFFFERSGRFLDALKSVSKPTVAAVHGLCLGAGLGLIAQIDIVLAADDARFGLPEGMYGLPGATDLVHQIGAPWSKFLIFTGELIDAAQAVEIGLALVAIPSKRLNEAAKELALRIGRAPLSGLQLNKLGINGVDNILAGGKVSVGRAHDALTAAMAVSALGPDGRSFGTILKDEGVSGLNRAVARPPWLRSWARRCPTGLGQE